MAAAATLPFLLISLLILFIHCSHIISCFAIAVTTTHEGQGQVPSSVTPKAAAVHYWHLKTRNNKPLPPVILSKLSPLSPTKLITTTDETMRAMSERPYDKYASHEERPYDKYASQDGDATASDDAKSVTFRYNFDSNNNVKMVTSDEVKENAARGIFSQGRPYDKYASQDRRPYDKYASQERPYDKYASQDGDAAASDDPKSATFRYNFDSNNNVKMVTSDEVKENAAEQNDPRGIFSEDRPYDKYASQDRRPYDKYASQERPYDKYASHERPYDKYASQERPYDKYASEDRRPYDKYASQERPYDKYASQDRRPYDKYASQERPYDKYASQDRRPYDKYASQERPYDKYASQDRRPYDKYASQDHRPYDKYASQDRRPYDKYASQDLHVHMMGDEVKEKTAEPNDPQGIFFRESELKEGKAIPLLKFESSDSGNYFLPRSIAGKIPLSASAVSTIFHIPTDSATYSTMKDTIGHCRMPPNTGETNRCVTSAEDLIDYALSTMGANSDIQVWSTHSSTGFGGKSLIGKVKVVYDGEHTGKQHLACHQLTFPYLVYHCHSVSNTKVYDMEILDGETKEKINQGVALCHLDTSAWDPKHMSFAALGSAPGKTEVCHWIHPWDMTLTATAATS